MDSWDQAPLASNDSFTVTHDQILTINDPGILGNDSDPDGEALTTILVNGPSNGSLWYLGPNGGFMYVPNQGFVGNDSFTYQASDGILNSNTATITIGVTDQAPIANNDN